jgi:undecaprenyl-diphosphatase
LNTLPAHIPVLGRLAVPAATYGVFLYAPLLLWLWFGATRRSTEGRRALLLAVLAAVLSLGVNAALNVLVPRPRPFAVLPAHVLVPPPRDASFPSDHAAVATAIGVTLWVGGHSEWGIPAVLGAAVIGLARVVVGVHYPSDIFGGMVTGAASAATGVGAKRLLRPVLDAVIEVARQLRLG